MTVTTIGTDLDNAVEDLTQESCIGFFIEPCAGLKYREMDCQNEPVYRIMVSCCAYQFNWCESCLFDWADYSDLWQDDIAPCMYCGVDVVIRPNHIIVVGRLK